MGQESENNLTGCFCLRVSHEAAFKVLATAAVSSGLDLHGFWPAAEDVLGSLTGASPQAGLTAWWLAFPRVSDPRVVERKCLIWRSWSSYNFIYELISPHTCHILFMRSKSVSLVHTWGEGITQGSEYQGVEINEGYLRGHQPHLWVLLSVFYHFQRTDSALFC